MGLDLAWRKLGLQARGSVLTCKRCPPRRRWASWFSAARPCSRGHLHAEEMGSDSKQEHMTTVEELCSQLVVRNHEDYLAVRPIFKFVFELFCFNKHFTAERICVSSLSVRAVHYNHSVNKFSKQ